MEKIKLILLIGLTVITLVLISSLVKSCDMSSEYERLTGEYNAFKVVKEVREAELTKEIGHLNDVIESAQKEIEILLNTRVKNERELSYYKAQLEEIVYKEPVQPELEDTPLVINLRQQIAKMSLIIDEQEQIIRGNDEIIFNLNQTYSSQLKISEYYLELYTTEAEHHALAVKRIGVLEKDLRGLKLGTNIKTGLIVGVMGVAAYLLLGGN